VASNNLGNDTSNASTVDVQFAPEISKNPEGLTRVKGQNVVFSCVVEGNPSLSVSWTKNGQGLNVAANSRLAVSRTNNNHNLTITDVHRSDAGQLLIFSVTSFKIDQNKNQNRSIDKVQILRKERKEICKDSRQDSGHSNVSYARYAEKLFTQIYRDLYGDAVLVPIRMGTNMAAGNQQKHLSLSFATKA